MSRRMTAQPRRLVVPPFQRLCTRWMWLPEGFTEVVKEAIGIRCREAAEELVAVLDERCLPAFGVAIEHNLAQRKRFNQAAGRRSRTNRHLDDDRRLRLEGG